MTPPDSLSETAVCLQITHPPNAISMENDSFLVSCIQECRNDLDLQHRTLEITLNQIITSSSQRLLFTFCLCKTKKKKKKKFSKQNHGNLQDWDVVIPVVQYCTRPLPSFSTWWVSNGFIRHLRTEVTALGVLTS